MISDVLPGSPADTAGLRTRDIIASVDGAPTSALPYYAAMMYLHDPAVPVAVTALRGEETLQFQVPAIAVDDHVNADAATNPHESLVSELRIFGKNINAALAVRNGFRFDHGDLRRQRRWRAKKRVSRPWRRGM